MLSRCFAARNTSRFFWSRFECNGDAIKRFTWRSLSVQTQGTPTVARSPGWVRSYAVLKPHRTEVAFHAKQRRNKMYRTIIYCSVAGGGIYGIFSMLEDSFMYYYTPTQLFEKNAVSNKKVRLGGVVVPGSVKTVPGTIAITFTLTDFNLDVHVTYTGLVPDLFREGEGCVCEGMLKDNGSFEAHTVLAKHDESYIPSDIAKEINRTMQEKEAIQADLHSQKEQEEHTNEVQQELVSGWQTFAKNGKAPV